MVCSRLLCCWRVQAEERGTLYGSLPRFPMNRVASAYRHSKRRLFMLDYDGTLQSPAQLNALQAPTAETLACLERLASGRHAGLWVAPLWS